MKNFVEAAQFAFAALGGALGAVLGLPVPQKLKDVLEQLKDHKTEE